MVLAYFMSLVTYTWMLVEGVNLLMIIVFIFQRKNKRIKEMCLLGYGNSIHYIL